MASSFSSPRGVGGHLKVNDPVLVERGGESHQKLEGIVAFVGKVSFADGDDWVGVRLTGTSIGLGKNDGSVKGIRYFDCSQNGGVFVRKSHVTKRVLTRLEELRLKRELAKSGGSSAATATPTPPRSSNKPTSTRTSPGSSASATTTTTTEKTTTSPTSPSARTRLDELRQRRAARLAEKTASPPSATPMATTSDTEQQQQYETKISSLTTQLEDLTQQLRTKQEENASLQQSLSKAEQDVHEARTQMEAAKEAAIEVKEKESDVPQQQETTTQQELLETTQQQLYETTSERDELQDGLSKLEQNLNTVKQELEREREGRTNDATQLTQAKTEVSVLQHELQALNDQTSVRSASDASHYKERAKLLAEVGSIKRCVEQLEAEKLDMSSMLEEITLDKEQLQEEKDALQDRLEEVKLDAETAQMEVEELKLELEDATRIASSVNQGTTTDAATAATSSGDAAGADADDVAQALSVQNARLREALIRLREQSLVEKMELSRELRAAEKEATASKAVTAEIESLQSTKITLEEQISDLKEMVEQQSAFETMVEDLSDRVLALEDDNVALQSTIREMEEAADITAEMEEVQAEENKALVRDLEGRDAIIRNLEEAIRMQRRREEDFQRTVANYRNSVETLKQEKNALLELQKGEKGEKSDLLASSQKALARAAQLVSDAADMRKREAAASFHHIESQILRHLSERLEMFLPPSVVAAELASIKGEVLLSKVAGKASRSLDGMATIFTKKIRTGASEAMSGVEPSEEEKSEAADTVVSLSDEASQGVATMIHQSKFALATVDLAAYLLRLLSAGQWPDLLTPEASAELGSLVGHSISDLDIALGGQLRTLKEEGVLSPHQTNLGSFEQTVRNTLQALDTSIESDQNLLLPSDWNPSGWQLFKDASVAKFSCLGAASAVAIAVSTEDGNEQGVTRLLQSLMTKLDQVSAQSLKACLCLARLDVNDEKLVADLTIAAASWKESSSSLMEYVQTLFSEEEGVKYDEILKCESAADEVMRFAVQFLTSLRTANLNPEEVGAFHPLSPEADDPWEGVASLAGAIRSIDGDEEDVNFLLRARSIEQQLTDAVNNEPKLSLANAKIAGLEKSLSSRSKEIAMQNARLSELEKLLAKTSARPSPRARNTELSTAEEMNSIKEENRVLTEAMDVLQKQVDEYEAEIRFLKDAKSPKPGRRPAKLTPRRTSSNITDYSTEQPGRLSMGEFQSPEKGKGGVVSMASVAAMEAAMFRPALQSARLDAATWKSKAFASSLLSLPPLDVPGVPAVSEPSSEEAKYDVSQDMDEAARCFTQLSTARSLARIAKASVSVVNLNSGVNSRASLRESLAKQAIADERLEKATASAKRWLSNNNAPLSSAQVPVDQRGGKLVGRVKFPGTAASGTIPIAVKKNDLQRLHMHLLQ